MKIDSKTHRRSERGIALLIAIFVLLLISVVAIALLVSSSTETALGANYKYSSTVYYAALAGLEEARGRLLPRNPNYFNNINPSLVPTPFPLGQTLYVINRSPGDAIQPWNAGNLYYDTEYQSEFGVAASSASWQSVHSVWDNNIQGIPGPIFKWVRINAVTEASLYIDVNYSGSYNSTTPLYYDPAHLNSHGNAWPSLIETVSPPSTAVQALEITALAYLPNGTKKILQYLVAPVTLNLTLPAALTLDGFNDSFTGPNHHAFEITGNSDSGDSACSSMPYPVPAIGVPDSADVGNARSGIPSSLQGNYTGTGGAPNPPSVGNVGPSLAANLRSVQSLNQIVQTILQNADSVIAGPANQSDLPSAMSNSNPMIVAVQGDPTHPTQGNFTLTGGFTGYGVLLVTGNFTYTSDSSWNGIILVIGQGTVTASSNATGGIFNGGMLVAQTRDTSGNLLTTGLGPASFSNTGHGSGISYQCSWIRSVQPALTYQVLSFHEIPQ